MGRVAGTFVAPQGGELIDCIANSELLCGDCLLLCASRGRKRKFDIERRVSAETTRVIWVPRSEERLLRRVDRNKGQDLA
jgi:hypothetical protein